MRDTVGYTILLLLRTLCCVRQRIVNFVVLRAFEECFRAAITYWWFEQYSLCQSKGFLPVAGKAFETYLKHELLQTYLKQKIIKIFLCKSQVLKLLQESYSQCLFLLKKSCCRQFSYTSNSLLQFIYFYISNADMGPYQMPIWSHIKCRYGISIKPY